jgi:hypothetical protein
VLHLSERHFHIHAYSFIELPPYGLKASCNEIAGSRVVKKLSFGRQIYLINGAITSEITAINFIKIFNYKRGDYFSNELSLTMSDLFIFCPF